MSPLLAVIAGGACGLIAMVLFVVAVCKAAAAENREAADRFLDLRPEASGVHVEKLGPQPARWQ
jgi:hypothetical protein